MDCRKGQNICPPLPALLLFIFLPLLFSCHREVLPPVTTPLTQHAERKLTSPAPQRVSFESLEHDSTVNKPTIINALLFKPTNSDLRRLPAVVALHGCGGMYSSSESRREELSLRHQAMANLLVAEGYAVLFPDSFRSRGFEEICTVDNKIRSVTPQLRRQDAQGALAWLQRRSDIQPERIAILGWSHGGSSVLATLNSKQPDVSDWRNLYPTTAYFRAGVAFYPGCNESMNVVGGYSLAAPLTLFIGANDDWTAPEPCINLAAQLVAAGENATITVYPDSYHGFDGPASQPRRRLNVPNGASHGRGVTMAPNPAARDDAYAKLKIYLKKYLGI
jgi:dienelactone hydrolase